MIAQNELKNLLHYEPETGIFRWNVPNRGHAKEGDMAGTRTGRYAYITINGQPYLAHRLAWFYVHGEWPKHTTLTMLIETQGITQFQIYEMFRNP